ncbi:MAG TPA: DUF3137 domain-containing protein [Bacteroidales bacterium]|nr:DUF3137 domain-containing protein [Bacteroidales bacterium]
MRIKLLPDLKILDKERKQVDRRVLIIGIITFVIFIAVVKLVPSGIKNLSAILQVTTVVFGFILISIVSKNYRLNFKTKIITKITGFADESIIYSPEGTVAQAEFVNSAIFQKSCNSFKGEDHFHGKIGQSLQAMSGSRGELIKLEDPEFEKEFCVYGDDQIEARYILSPALMQRIVEFKRKWNTKVYLSFRDSKVYIAIKLNKNLFETRLFKSIVDYAFIEENIRFLVLLTGIVEDLNLNTRIWTKQ